jgi:hypothetical protein
LVKHPATTLEEVDMLHAPRVLALSLSLSLFAPLALTACRTGNAYDIEQKETGDTVLEVRNQNYADMDVYAYSGGLATRIGTVVGSSTQSFALKETLLGAGDFRIIATPIGGNGRASTGNLSVSPGQTIHFTIGITLRQSFTTVN